MEALFDEIDIIDGHTHIASSKSFLPEFYKPITENAVTAMKSYFPKLNEKVIAEKLEGLYEDHDAEKFKSSMDKARVKKAVLLLPDFTYAFCRELSELKEQIERHLQIIRNSPDRFYLMIGVDPRWGREGFELFSEYAEKGLIQGMKVYTPCGYYPADPAMEPYYELCTEKKLPVLFHTGPTSAVFPFKYSDVKYVDDVAYKYKEMNIILAHGGVIDVDSAVALCSFRPNVYLDFSGYICSLDPRGLEAAMRDLFRRKINHKIIFGTDWPIGGYKNTYESMVNMLLKQDSAILSDLSKPELKMIFNETIQRLMGTI